MAREPVAVDFLGLGRGGEQSPEDSERGTLVRPIPSVPENLAMGSGSRSSHLLESSQATDRESSLNQLRQGLRRPPWNKQGTAARHHADMRSEDDSGKTDVSPKRESPDIPPLGHAPSLSGWDQSAPVSPSHPPTSSSNRYQEMALAQQARMRAAAMYANGLVAPRTVQNSVAQTSSPGDEAHQGAQPSERAGPEHLSVSVSATQQHPPSSQGTGFGFPLPFFSRMKGNGGGENGVAMAGHKLLQLQQSVQGGNLAGHTARSYQAAGNGKQPRTAQLTIFYAGMVNVYDDVPYDKAQAIILLAGSGSTWSSNHMNPPANGAPGRPFSAPMAVPQPTASTPASPGPQAPTTSGGPPLPLLPGAITTFRQPVARNANIAELPQARKASLARFLEKRKDRVRKAPYPLKNEGSVTPPRDKSPSPSNSKPGTRSPSPASTSGTPHHQLSSSGPRHQPCGSSGSEPNSPTRPGGTPPRQSMSEEKSTGTLGATEYEKERESLGRSPCRRAAAVESRVDAMEEDLS